MKISTWLVLSSVVETVCFIWIAVTAFGVNLIPNAIVLIVNLMATWFFLKKDSRSLI